MPAKREELDRPNAEPNAAATGTVERLDEPVRDTAETEDSYSKFNESLDETLNRHRERTDALIRDSNTPDTQHYRVVTDQIGQKVIKKQDEKGPVIIDFHGGIRGSKDKNKPTIVTADDIERALGEGARHQIPRYLIIGAIVPVIPYVVPGSGLIRWLDIETPDHIPFSANPYN